MKKKVLALVLCVALVSALCVGLVFGLTACNDGGSELKAIAKEDIKIGFIMLHDPEQSTYDNNFYTAMEAAKAALGLRDDQVLYKHTVDESADCYNAAVDMIEEGCNIIFADSFGHETYLMQAAEEFPSVRFAHATGTHAHTAGLDNFYNAFASIYEGRYLAGVAAGLKLQEMINNGELTAANYNGSNIKVGYVGAFPYAEVVSGYTSWFLGVRSIVENVEMQVTYTASWFDLTREKESAEKLIANGCALISQHADSMGAPTACADAGVPNVTYNVSTEATCSGSYIAGSRINWAPYLEYLVNCAINNETISKDWTGTIATGSVEVLALGAAAANGTAAKLDEVKAKLADGTLKVFDTSKFTVNGQTLTEYLADVDDAGDYIPETQVIANGYFHESEYRSAPYFDIRIDGITELDGGNQWN